MWKEIALAVAMLAPATASQLDGGPAPGKTFAPTCRDTQLTDSRPDPAWVGQSFARDSCTAPQMPAPIDGLTASRNEIVAGMAATNRYAAASDAYQRCIRDFVAVRQSHQDQSLSRAPAWWGVAQQPLGRSASRAILNVYL